MDRNKQNYEAPKTEVLDLELAKSFVQTIGAQRQDYKSEEW